MAWKALQAPLTVALVLGLYLRATCACPSFRALLGVCGDQGIDWAVVCFSKSPFLIFCVILFSFPLLQPGLLLPLSGQQHCPHCWRAGEHEPQVGVPELGEGRRAWVTRLGISLTPPIVSANTSRVQGSVA